MRVTSARVTHTTLFHVISSARCQPPPILGGDLEILLKFSRGGPEIFFNFGGDLNLRGGLNFRGGAGK